MKGQHIISVLFSLVVAGCAKNEIPQQVPAENTAYYQDGLAQLNIFTEDERPILSKETYVPCNAHLVGKDIFEDHLFMKAEIRGRGNSTWGWYPKKPYRLKLEESTPLLGMAANRDWVLLADFRDVTHLMNNVAFTMAHELGLPCANHSRYVTLYINERNMGLYMVTEQVEEGGNRVPLDKEEGILLALDLNDGPGESPSATNNFYSTVFKSACAVKYPKDPDSAAKARVKKEFATLESAINQRRWQDIQNLLDIDAMMNYILIQEIIGNGEVDNNPSMRSGYIHRHDNASKWVMGPFWDADAGFGYDGADMFNHNGMCHTYFKWNVLVFGTEPFLHKGAMNGTAPDFFCRLWGIPEFVRLLKARWNACKTPLLQSALKQIDRTEEVIGDAAREDMTLWGINKFSHEKEVAKLKTWLQNRFTYLNSVINDYPEKRY